MPNHCAFLKHYRAHSWFALAFCLFLAANPPGSNSQTVAQSGAPKKASARDIKNSSPRTSIAPHYAPGQVFRYAMEFETTTSTTQSGFSTDPQGPASLVITWDATIRMEVLPAETGKAGMRLRTTYEKSNANIRADTFDPTADATKKQYENLEGKVVEFTLGAAGKVKSVSGLEGIVEGEKAAQAAREWINRLDASSGAPPGGVLMGQTWTSDEPASALPIAGMVWRTDSQYLRNEPCRPPNPDLPPDAAPARSLAGETCAVILTQLNLIRPKSVRDPTPEDYRKNGVQTKGTWTGSGQSLTYVSLRSGAVVSVSQSGSEGMDVTLTSNHNNTAMRYAGTVRSRSQVELIGDEAQGK